MLKKAILFGLLTLGISYLALNFLTEDETVPTLPEPNWGPNDKSIDDTSVRPFHINVTKDVISDLNQRLSMKRNFVPPLLNTGWTYGISNKYLENVIDYWKNKYNWYNRQDLLNKYPQYITNIQGLDIHFYHIKPKKNVDSKTLKVVPLLMVHGWPGSIVEFQKIIPMLTSPRADRNFVFELILPSVPGYGFSQGAIHPGLGHAEIAVIFKNLMTRLGFEKFYTQGGDWGSVITTDIAILFPDRVYGTHSNMCSALGMKSLLWQLIGAYFPSLVIDAEHHSRLYPLKTRWSRIMEETGYMHIQATKPDTIGFALSQSPAALMAYIFEKFSTWTNPEYRFRDDGGLLEKYNLDELLDNIMVYWVTNSITTSARLYAESFSGNKFSKYQALSTNVPTACAIFPHEMAYVPEFIMKSKYKNLVQFNYLPRGGHFAAFEEPQILSDDIWQFVEKIEAQLTHQTKK